MASSLQTADGPKHFSSDLSQMFVPQETLDHPFDVTLVVEDGKEFKAHSDVLSEGSPYFQTLLKSDIKAAEEGIILLEMISEAIMQGILEFIYTGGVQILNQETAIDLFNMADYLLMRTLKAYAGDVLLNKLNVINCISTYYFVLQRNHNCQELVSQTKKYIFANFISVANTEEFLNLSNKEVEMWISSDEINVNAEEDVFKMVVTWIDCDKSRRKKYFAQLFRQVRLVYVPRDVLCSYILTKDLVKYDRNCMEQMEDALKSIDSKNYDTDIYVKPRKSLETPVIVIVVVNCILRYFPRKNRWCTFGSNSMISSNLNDYELASCRGKLYFMNPSVDGLFHSNMLRYDSFSNSWKSLQYKEDRCIKQIFVINDDAMYALVSEKCQECGNLSCLCCRGLLGESFSGRAKTLVSFITKYKPDSNSWEEITSFDFGLREGMCIVTKNNFIYFIGGGARVQCIYKSLPDVNRYDLSTNHWDKVADLQEERMFACGSTSQGKIFVAGGVNDHGERALKTCEVYNETTNEWHFIASMLSKPGVLSSMLCVDGKLYVVGGCHGSYSEGRKVKCYDPESNEWNEEIEIPLGRKKSQIPQRRCYLNACLMRVFTRCPDNLYPFTATVKH